VTLLMEKGATLETKKRGQSLNLQHERRNPGDL
jgi:hypothetical protein